MTALHEDVMRRQAELAAAPLDVAAGRRYVHAYTLFMHFVEEVSGHHEEGTVR
jgi:hypothetical protein